jgi:hypothetical protein
MCPILDGYGVKGIFQLPYTPSCEPRLTEPADVLGGLSFALQELFLPPDSPRGKREGGVGIRLASAYCMSQLLLRVQKR